MAQTRMLAALVLFVMVLTVAIVVTTADSYLLNDVDYMQVDARWYGAAPTQQPMLPFETGFFLSKRIGDISIVAYGNFNGFPSYTAGFQATLYR